MGTAEYSTGSPLRRSLLQLDKNPNANTIKRFADEKISSRSLVDPLRLNNPDPASYWATASMYECLPIWPYACQSLCLRNQTIHFTEPWVVVLAASRSLLVLQASHCFDFLVNSEVGRRLHQAPSPVYVLPPRWIIESLSIWPGLRPLYHSRKIKEREPRTWRLALNCRFPEPGKV